MSLASPPQTIPPPYNALPISETLTRIATKSASCHRLACAPESRKLPRMIGPPDRSSRNQRAILRTHPCSALVPRLGISALVAVSAAPGSQPSALVSSPSLDAGVITREQNIRDPVAPKFWRPRVTRRAQTATEERIGSRAFEIRHRAWKQANCRVHDGERGGLATAQHKIPERNFFGREIIRDALVDVLVVTA